MVKTLEEAARLVEQLEICTIFESSKTELSSLWEHVDLPDKKKGEKGWGQKITAVWTWKNQLPAEYPTEIYYGKIKGGFAVLMSMKYLREKHFAKAHKEVGQLSELAQFIFEKIRIEPWETTGLRKEVVQEFGCSKSQFDTALKNLQISMNIVRAIDADIERDTWLTFREVYPDIWEEQIND